MFDFKPVLDEPMWYFSILQQVVLLSSIKAKLNDVPQTKEDFSIWFQLKRAFEKKTPTFNEAD